MFKLLIFWVSFTFSTQVFLDILGSTTGYSKNSNVSFAFCYFSLKRISIKKFSEVFVLF